jgi:AraC family L-rhamnose operon transcriptional activator RhaR
MSGAVLDPTLLERRRLFPGPGALVHVNRPLHDGDVPLHRHDFVEIALVVEGRALHRTIGGLEPVARGDALVLPPGRWHAYERCRGLHLANCCFAAELLVRELAWTGEDPRLAGMLSSASEATIRCHLPPAGLDAAVAACEALRVLQGQDDPAHRPGILGNLLLVFAALAPHAPQLPSRPARPPGVVAAITAMDAELARPWSLAELARRAGRGRAHLVRSFHRATGLPPGAWLARRRGQRAAVLLLTTDLPVAEIGKGVGWDDPNYFARRFRALYGQPPRRYREQLPCPPILDGELDAWIQW